MPEDSLLAWLKTPKPYRPYPHGQVFESLCLFFRPKGIFPNAFRYVPRPLQEHYRSRVPLLLSESDTFSTRSFSFSELTGMIDEIIDYLEYVEQEVRSYTCPYHNTTHNVEVLHRDLLIWLADREYAYRYKKDLLRAIPEKKLATKLPVTAHLRKSLDKVYRKPRGLVPSIRVVVKALLALNVPSCRLAERIVSRLFHDCDHTGRTLKVIPQDFRIDNSTVQRDPRSRNRFFLRVKLHRRGERVSLTLQGQKLLLDPWLIRLQEGGGTIVLDEQVFLLRQDARGNSFLRVYSPYNLARDTNEEVATNEAIAFAIKKGMTFPQLLRINSDIISSTVGYADIQPDPDDSTALCFSYGADMGNYAYSFERYLVRTIKLMSEFPHIGQKPGRLVRPGSVFEWLVNEYNWWNRVVVPRIQTLPAVETVFGARLESKVMILKELEDLVLSIGMKFWRNTFGGKSPKVSRDILKQHPERLDAVLYWWTRNELPKNQYEVKLKMVLEKLRKLRKYSLEKF